MTKLNPKLLLDVIYPIGSVYINVDGTNPGTFLGGTWVALAVGKTLVGLDTSQTEFDTLLKTGGNKYIQDHTHQNIELGGNTMTAWSSSGSGGVFNLASLFQANQPNNNKVNTGGVVGDEKGNSGNLQPYIVVAIWRRTA